MASSSSSVPRDPPVAFVEHCKGVNGLDKIILRDQRGNSVEVYLYGAQVTSWKIGMEEQLFVSKKAFFSSPNPIRGGIPICFPQYEGSGSLEKHGFVRSRFWSVDTNPPAPPRNSHVQAYTDLILKPSEDDFVVWPHKFELRLRILLSLRGDLVLSSSVRNTDNSKLKKPFTFRFVYHTYFSVSDIGEIRVEKLETSDYFDNTKNGQSQRLTEQGNAITFEAEMDKVYLSTPKKIKIVDHKKKRTFVICKTGLPDAVVWNPWEKKAKAIADLDNKEYRNMVCVEAAAVEKPITLKPGEVWKGKQILSVTHANYSSGQLDTQRVLPPR